MYLMCVYVTLNNFLMHQVLSVQLSAPNKCSHPCAYHISKSRCSWWVKHPWFDNPPEICHVRKFGWCTDMCIFSLFSWESFGYLMARHPKNPKMEKESHCTVDFSPLYICNKHICESADQAVAKNGKVLWSLHNKHVAARHHCHSENTWQIETITARSECKCLCLLAKGLQQEKISCTLSFLLFPSSPFADTPILIHHYTRMLSDDGPYL